MRDVNNGWFVRYLHANTASAFFLLVYLHVGRGMYYASFKTPRVLVWIIGTVILIMMIVIGFLGYLNSPKWLNINIYIFLIYYIIFIYLNIYYYIYYNSIVTTKNYNKFNNKFIIGLNKRFYSSTSNNGEINISDRLNLIIKELGLNPVYIFENLDSENTRQQILKSTKGLSGIYMILNKVTKDYYIGSASTDRFYARFSNHVIYFKGSKVVKAAVKKYELKNFSFIILELFPDIVTQQNNRDLLDLEDKYLKLLLPNYNILTEAGSSFGYKHTEIDRQKMKDIYSEERRERIGNLNRGKKLSPETIEKLREKALKRPPMSIEIRLKCITRTRPVILYNLNGTIYGKYSTIIEAANAINCNEKTIRRALKTEKKLVKREWIVNDLSNK